MKSQEFKTEEEVKDFYRRKSLHRNLAKGAIFSLGVSMVLGAPIYSMIKYPSIERTPLVTQYIQAESNLGELEKLRNNVPFPSNFTNYSPEVQTHLNQAFQKEIAQRQSLDDAVSTASQQLSTLRDTREVRDYLYQTHIVDKKRIKNTLAYALLGIVTLGYGLLGLISNPYFKRKQEALEKLRSPR
jgi:hypothetical protein